MIFWNGNVKVELPSALLKAANLEEGNISQEAARLLALELYREDRISLGRAAELCQTPLAAFMDFADKHGVPPLRYGLEDLEGGRRSSNKIEA
jgi:predicted HTH domain antitoxin